MVKEFQSVISREAKKQFYEAENRLPDAVMACVGGGSNSIGMFADFIEEKGVKLIGVEAAGKGIKTGEHAIAYAKKYAKGLQEALGKEKAMGKSLIVCLSGRGDKDVNTIADYLDGKGYLN